MERLIWNFESECALFSSNTSRFDLHSLDAKNGSELHVKVNVWRNHSIEPILSLIKPYMKFADYMARFDCSGYDDSFSFKEHRDADVELIWFDPTRYAKMVESAKWSWISRRLFQLRELTDKPIIFVSWYTSGDKEIFANSFRMPCDTYFIDLNDFAETESLGLIEDRTKNISGTPLSPKIHCKIARSLGCQWLPAALGFHIRAVLVDLDNTLHSGIIAEDGVEGLELTTQHQQLHKSLLDLKKRGIFLALVSRNELDDVKRVFEEKFDYGLRFSDFSIVEASWDAKSAAIARIAKNFRIGLDSVLFIDDNTGELAEVASSLGSINLIHAKKNPDITRASLENFPGIWRFKYSDEDYKRINDWSANSERAKIQERSISEKAYFDDLQIDVRYSLNDMDHIERLQSLSQKTNQFNLSFKRYHIVDISRIMSSRDMVVISISLSDRLSDSGIIGMVVASINDKTCTINELCLSCRAMGRGLENSMIMGALKRVPRIAFCDKIEFRIKHGERNSPARNWLGKLVSKQTDIEPGAYTIPVSQIGVLNTMTDVSD